MKILFLFLLLQQVPADNSPDRTHKAKREQTVIADKGKPCAVLHESKSGFWRVYLTKNGTYSQLFDTRAEAVKWAKGYCGEAK